MPKKSCYFQSKANKITPPRNFVYSNYSLYQISLLTILSFWTKFAQEKYLWSKTEKVHIIIEFRIFKLVLVPNFSLNWQFWFFWPDLPKKGFSGVKQKKCTPRIFYIILHIQVSLVQNFISNWQFWFFGPHLTKKAFPVENRTSSPRTTSFCFLWSKC